MILALCAFENLNIYNLWINFGSGKYQRLLPIHEYANTMGKRVCDAMLFFHAFTFSMIQQFVIRLYTKSIPSISVNECRRMMVTKLGRSLENIPPTEAALLQHTSYILISKRNMSGRCDGMCRLV